MPRPRKSCSSNMSQLSPGGVRGDHAPHQNPSKSHPNLSAPHLNQRRTASEYRIYKKTKGSQQENRTTSGPSWPAVVCGDEAILLNMEHREQSTTTGRASRGCGWQAPPPAGGAGRVQDARQVGFFNPLPRSYAEVVQGTMHATLRHTDASSCTPPPAQRSSLAARRRRSVLFVDSPNVAVFLKGSVPADIFLLAQSSLASKTPTTKLKLRPCLKYPSVTTQRAVASSVSGNQSIIPSPTVMSHPHLGSYLPTTYVSQDLSDETPWQVVKGNYWWRKGKSNSSYFAPTAQQPSHTTFYKLKTRGRCFNCLARGHQVANCRDLPKCWRCGGSGHISYHCSYKEHGRKQRRNGSWPSSHVIHIIPQEHSKTTQELEAWFTTVDKSRKTTSLPHLEIGQSDDNTISSLDAPSLEIVSPSLDRTNLDSTNEPIEMRAWRWLWKSRHATNSISKAKAEDATGKRTIRIGEQFIREALPYSDAIRIVPLVSFSEEQRKFNMESTPCTKHTETRLQHAHRQQSEDVEVPPITASQQSRMLDELHTAKLNGRKLPPSESKIDESMAKTPNVEEIVTEETSNSVKKISETDLGAESNFAIMLQKFKEAVTKPLEPCLLQTPDSKSIDKKGKKEKQSHNTEQKIKLKKQRMVVNELTLKHVETHKKPLSSSTPDKCKKLIARKKEKKKKKKISPVTIKIAKKKKSRNVD